MAGQAAEQQGFPGSYFTCDDDEAFVSPDAVVQSGKSLIVAPGRNEAIRVGRKLERIAL